MNEKEKKPLYKNKYLLIILAVIAANLIFSYNYSIIIVSGSSMNPAYFDGDFLISNKHFNIDRFDCVTIYTDEKCLIKRVIGLPGDTVEYKNNQLYINNKKIDDKYSMNYTDDFKTTVDKNCYYCLGDNRQNSSDSRYYGEFNEKYILSKIISKGDKQ